MRFRAFPKRFRTSPFIFAAAGALLLASLSACEEPAEDRSKVGETIEHQDTAETPSDPCFDGKLSIGDVLDACEAFIAKGNDDKKLLIRAHSIRALGFSATGNLDKALDEMTAAVEIDPKRANSYFMRAAGYDASKEYDKAIADLDTAIGLNGGDADYYLLRGTVYSHKNDYDAALVDLTKKIELDAKAINGYSTRGELYRKRKEYDLSAADYTEVIKLDPQSAKGYIDRGWIYVLMDDLDKAGPDFDAALKIQENNALALVGRGVVKSRKGQPTDGSADLRLAEKLEPGVFDQIRALGVK